MFVIGKSACLRQAIPAYRCVCWVRPGAYPRVVHVKGLAVKNTLAYSFLIEPDKRGGESPFYG